MTLTNFVVACSQYDESADKDPKKPARTYILSSLISMLIVIFLIATFLSDIQNLYFFATTSAPQLLEEIAFPACKSRLSKNLKLCSFNFFLIIFNVKYLIL